MIVWYLFKPLQSHLGILSKMYSVILTSIRYYFSKYLILQNLILAYLAVFCILNTLHMAR
jgi:hypothetical protein